MQTEVIIEIQSWTLLKSCVQIAAHSSSRALPQLLHGAKPLQMVDWWSGVTSACLLAVREFVTESQILQSRYLDSCMQEAAAGYFCSEDAGHDGICWVVDTGYQELWSCHDNNNQQTVSRSLAIIHTQLSKCSEVLQPGTGKLRDIQLFLSQEAPESRQD